MTPFNDLQHGTQGPMPPRDRGAYQPNPLTTVPQFTGWYPEFGQMHVMLLQRGYEHYDNLYEQTDGISSARLYRTMNHVHRITLWKNGKWEVSKNYQVGMGVTGFGMKALEEKLKEIFFGEAK